MNKILFVTILFLNTIAYSQNLYNPKADAQKEINDAVIKASKLKKHVFIMAGGNWCKWCLKFDKFSKKDLYLDSIIKSNYEVIHLNYSGENKNEKIFSKYGYPNRFGFPVFIILDEKGNRIHTQDTSYFENGSSESYDRVKVSSFLEQWSYEALHPKK